MLTRLHYRLDGVGFLDCRRHIWVCDAATGEARQLTDGDYDDYGAAWSPDGQWIAFAANRCEDADRHFFEVDLWLVSPQSGELRRIPIASSYRSPVPESLAWSPDGSHIAYFGVAAGADPWLSRNMRLWAAPVAGGPAQCLTEELDRTTMNMTISDTADSFVSAPRPVWSHDGRRLFFLASDRGSCHLYTVGLEERRPRPITSGGLDVISFSADRAGRRFALALDQPTRPAEVFVGSWDADAAGPMELRRVSHLNDRWLEEVRVSEPEEVWFNSADGTSIQGWLLRPPDFDPRQAHPLLLYIHGSPIAQYGQAFFHELQVHAARGYVVFCTNPRSSVGREEQFAACISGRWGELKVTVPMGGAADGWSSGAVPRASRSARSSARAAWRKLARSAPSSASRSASNSASCLEGRRSSASILRMVLSAQPTRRASSAWVRSSALRRRRSQ